MELRKPPVDDAWMYNLEDTLRPILREGTQRARDNHQNIIAEKMLGVQSALVTLAKSIVEKDADIEAAATKAAGKKNGDARVDGRDTKNRETFPS